MHNVTVADEFRRRGAATAMTVGSLLAAREWGAKVAVGHATAMGRPVYPRLGFAEICRLECYVRHPG